jgi:hypothetical protein
MNASPENSDQTIPTVDGSLRTIVTATAVTSLFFLPLLPTDLCLDELGSYWVIKDDLRTVIDRAVEIQGQSPLYYVLLWGAVQMLGVSPWALRIPSLLFIFVSSLLVSRLATLLRRPTAGFLSVFGFLFCFQIDDAAIQARPYALAILCASASSILLVKWFRSPGILSSLLYSLSAALTVYAHYLFGCVLLVHAGWFLCQFKAMNQLNRRGLLTGIAVIGASLALLLFPALNQLRWLSSRSAVLSFAYPPTAIGVVTALIPIEILLVAAVIIIFHCTIWRVDDGRKERKLSTGESGSKQEAAGVLASRCLPGSISFSKLFPEVFEFLRQRFRSFSTDPFFVMLIALVVIPPIALLGCSLFTGHSLWLVRYYSVQSVGIGMAIGLAVSAVPSFSRQLVIVAVLALIKLTAQYTLMNKQVSGEGWGRAFQAIQSVDPDNKCLLLNVSSFIESRRVGQGSSPVEEDFMRAPLYYYRSTNESALIPFSFDSGAAQTYLHSAVLPPLERASCAWLLYWNVRLFAGGSPEELSAAWLKLNLPELGFTPSFTHSWGLVDAIRYDRMKPRESIKVLN